MIGILSKLPGALKVQSLTAAIAVVMTCTVINSVVAQSSPHLLRLSDGSVVLGRLESNASSGQMSFLAPGLVAPVTFDAANVRSVRRLNDGAPDALQANQPDPDSATFLTTDDLRITGRILGMDEQSVQIDSAILGKLELPREKLRFVQPSQQVGQLVPGTTDAESWKDPNKSDAWHIDATSIATDKSGVRLLSNFALPRQAEVRLELKTGANGDFCLSFAADNSKQVDKMANQWAVPEGHTLPQVGGRECFASVEVWNGQLMLVAESDASSDFVELGPVDSELVELMLYLDLDAGIASAVNKSGELKQVRTQPWNAALPRAMLIRNAGSMLTVSRLEISTWNSHLPPDLSVAAAQVTKADKTNIDGQIVGWDAETQSWLVQTAEEELSVAAADLLMGAIAHAEPVDPTTDSDGKQSTDADTASQPDHVSQVKVLLYDGTWLAGDLLAAQTPNLVLQSPLVSSPLNIPIDAIRSIDVSKQLDSESADAGTPQPPKDAQLRLLVNGTDLRGTLVPSDTAAASLLWQANLAVGPVAIDPAVSGVIRSITQRKAATPTTSAPTATNTVQRPAMAAGLLLQMFGVGANAQPKDNVPAEKKVKPKRLAKGTEIRFRSGDVAPAEIERITEGGVQFKSDRTSTTFAPTSAIDQIVFQSAGDATLTPEERQRLLTIPRAAKNDPPTHLLISTSGDFVRGHLMQVVDGVVDVEVRGQSMQFPLSEIAEIIWLYERNWQLPSDQPQSDPTAPLDEAQDPRLIHILFGTDQGITILPMRMADGTLFGQSHLLGDVQVALADMQLIFFGPDASSQARQRQGESFELMLAKSPKEANESGGDGDGGSTAHPLVGNVAPEFTLQTFEGDDFQLKSHRGKVVVLDFWASWCGPCMQSMPLLDEMIAQFDPAQVELYAVNIQEPAARIELALKCLQVECEVVLDSDGEVAAAYQANAIPQTVVIDAQGQVANVFVGGGGQTVANIQQAIQRLIAPTDDSTTAN